MNVRIRAVVLTGGVRDPNRAQTGEPGADDILHVVIPNVHGLIGREPHGRERMQKDLPPGLAQAKVRGGGDVLEVVAQPVRFERPRDERRVGDVGQDPHAVPGRGKRRQCLSGVRLERDIPQVASEQPVRGVFGRRATFGSAFGATARDFGRESRINASFHYNLL